MGLPWFVRVHRLPGKCVRYVSSATTRAYPHGSSLKCLENSLPFFKRLSDAWQQDNVDLRQLDRKPISCLDTSVAGAQR